MDKDNQQYEDPIASTEMLLHKDSGVVELFNDSFTSGQKENYIEYSAGYTTADMPPDLKLVVHELIAKKFYDTDEKRQGISQRNVMTENISFVIQDISNQNMEVIMRYKKPPRQKGVAVTGWTEAS